MCAVLGTGWGQPSLEVGLLRLLQGEVSWAGSLVQLPPRGRDTDLPCRTPSSLSAGVGWAEGARRLGTWVCVCVGGGVRTCMREGLKARFLVVTKLFGFFFFFFSFKIMTKN